MGALNLAIFQTSCDMTGGTAGALDHLFPPHLGHPCESRLIL